MSATRRMALVAMTGRRQDKARQAGVDAGFDHYMIKPIDFEKLMAIIETLDKY
jgi:DNA-binding response OmpR family regulator